MLLPLALAGLLSFAAAASGPVINTKFGPVQGAIETSLGTKLAAFRGIPYAGPPLGPTGRWKPPLDPVSMLMCARYARGCLVWLWMCGQRGGFAIPSTIASPLCASPLLAGAVDWRVQRDV